MNLFKGPRGNGIILLKRYKKLFNVTIVERSKNIELIADCVNLNRKVLKMLKWKFDWSKVHEDGYDIYGIVYDKELQGLVALRVDEPASVVEINLVESAPHNIGSNGKYDFIGECLFAIASKISFDAGLGGYVSFLAKTTLINYYEENLGANRIGSSQRMYLDTESSIFLVNNYILNN